MAELVTSGQEDKALDGDVIADVQSVDGACDTSGELSVKRKLNASKGDAKQAKQLTPGRLKLQSWLNKNVKVEMTDGRILIGAFLCTDQGRNIILGSCNEYLKANDEDDPRFLGLAMVPGHHIVSIHIDDTMKVFVTNLPTKGIIRKCDRPGFGEDMFDETSYYFENGLRKVFPYYFTYTTYCKRRWINQKLVDVFMREFRTAFEEEYIPHIENGQITVNLEKVGLDYVLKDGDLIAHVSHRHETPVTMQGIKILHKCDDLIVIDKPASIPVHPCGRYRHNTVTFILGKEFGLRNLKIIHRIDRLTSGILVMGRTSKIAREMEKQMVSRLIHKEYLALVEGEFPSDLITCDSPIRLISNKVGISRVHPQGKLCKTDFQKLDFDGTNSLVLCKPHTGRMHQIRVHLQYLGYPILNDNLYNHLVFGPQKGKNGDFGGKSDEELVQQLISIHNNEVWIIKNADKHISEKTEEKSNGSTVNSAESLDVPNQSERSASRKDSYDPNCLTCKREIVYRDPEPNDLIMYLHAWRYKGPDWEFETDIPDWAKDKMPKASCTKVFVHK